MKFCNEEHWVLFRDRNDDIQIFERDALEHHEPCHPVVMLAIDVMGAGYEGVIVDAEKMSNERAFIALQTNDQTPEGRIIENLYRNYWPGQRLPSKKKKKKKIASNYTKSSKS